ncbi:hypothetical protein [Gordonia sp. (in: high G+C Gram-positive bacteria)]|uniref:DUF7257 domain-containing protein n=1 Tax=Gordonia sp. (in: high G+C Gram-positive bacteria) TaxID=84139 RepID=UPI0039E4CA63
MTAPGLGPSSSLPEGVLTASQLGTALQGLNATKVGDTTQSRLPEVFTGTLGGDLVDAPIKYVMGLFADFLGNIVDDTTPALSGPEDLDDLVHDFFEGLPLIGIFVSIADAMLGTYDGDDPALISVQNLFGLLRKLLELISGVASGQVPDLGQLVTGFQTLFQDIASWLLGPNGLIRPSLLGNIDIGALTNTRANMAFDGDFALPQSPGAGAPPAGTWFRDPDKGAGSATITGAGELPELIDAPVAVEPGQQLALSGEARWSGSVGRAQLLVYGFNDDQEQISTTIVDDENLTGGQPKPLGGSWTAPADVVSASVAVQVTGMGGGQVWFDNIRIEKPGLIPQGWVSELEEHWNDLLAAFGIGGGTLADIGKFLTNLLKMFGLSSKSPLLVSPGSFDPASLGAKLHDALSPQSVQDTIDNIFNGFANLGELLDFNRPRGDVIDTIAGLLGMNLSTQSQVSTMEAEIRLLKSAGNTLSDNFERASGGLGASWQNFHNWAGGSGDIGVDGKGNMVWKASGGSTRGRMYRHLTAGSPSQITTDSCEVSVVLASDPPDAGSPGAYTYPCFSVSSSSEISYGRLRIGRTKVAIEAVVNGVVTTLAESPAIDPRAGQTLTVRRGGPGNTNLHTYKVLRNGVEVWSYTDPGSTIKSGSGFRGHGQAMQAASREVVPIFLYEQWLPAALAVTTYAEVL